jgi:hypothetical protein
MAGLIERVSTDRWLAVMILALCVATTILVALVGFYVPILRAFWNLL